MRSVENKQVENFVRNFAIEKLESSKLFTSVYGKRFAKQQMEENVKSVQVESEKSKDYMKYNLADKSIYLLIGKGENLEVNLNDLKKNNEVLFVILHECIHAILRNKKGTGLLEIYENETELGRGLNEGLTNWIADKTSKLGLYINEIEDNIIRELELAIGPKKVMSLGKGNIKKNGTKLLGMTKTEMVEFCKKIDLVYFLKLDIQQYSKIKTILEKSDTTSEQKNSELEKLKENFTAKEILEKKFPKYMKKYGKGTTIEDKLEFAKRMEKDLTETQNEVKESIQISIFNKYFKKEFYENFFKGNDEKTESIKSDFSKYLQNTVDGRKQGIENAIQAVCPNMTKIKLSEIQASSNAEYIEQACKKLDNCGKKQQTKQSSMVLN